MKSVFILALLACGMCWGQTADECKPSSLNIPGAPYPCVYPDHRVAFRVAAPDAQKVQVRLGGVHNMTRGADGLWTVTIPPQVVGFHYYSIVVDGAVMADPATRTFFGSGWDNSGIEIPAPDADFYAAKDVPHGEVSQRWFSLMSPENGVAALSTRRQAMGSVRTRGTRFCICCMAGAKTSRAGPRRGMWISSSIT